MNICVISKSGQTQMECVHGESLLEAMKRHGIYVPAYCGGRGTCGKCNVRLVKGDLEITAFDRKALTDKQLEEGMRLSCRAYPKMDLTVELCTETEDDFDVLTGEADAHILRRTGSELPGAESFGSSKKNDVDSSYGIAVDIGTTTIAMELLGLQSKQVYETDSRINHQRAFGADVISRIQAACSGDGRTLREMILKDLGEGIRLLIHKAGILTEKLESIVISANTTMVHLLMGYSCETLGVSPFTPVNLDVIHTSMGDLFDDAPADIRKGLPVECPVTILPGISAFVGADIVAGLLVCGFNEKRPAPAVFIDLGTNGEMAIGDGQRLIATSTAAGPAFEGGNISCGIGSVRGAICAVKISDGEVQCETIGGAPPLGICGTGVLDITAELVKHGIVDETGLMEDDRFDDGLMIARKDNGEPIAFTQQDVREIQLAKAAVRAGIEVLLKRFGIHGSQVDTVYLAGGFGFRLDVEKAIAIGLLPEAFRGKIQIAGNTSQKGARACLLDERCVETAAALAKTAQEISLGNDDAFEQFYVDAMYFENEV